MKKIYKPKLYKIKSLFPSQIFVHVIIPTTHTFGPILSPPDIFFFLDRTTDIIYQKKKEVLCHTYVK